MSWNPPRGYKGLRTGYRHAVKVKVFAPNDPWNRNTYWLWVNDLEDWCEEHCKHHWSHIDGLFWFDKVSEAVLFKMTFGGR